MINKKKICLEVEDVSDVLDSLLSSLKFGLPESAGNQVALLVLNLKHFLLDTENDKCLKLQNNYWSYLVKFTLEFG
jgi:hypothetical protein